MNFYIKTKNRLIKTKIPAPGTNNLIKKLSKVESKSMHGQVPIAWQKAENFNIYDIAGNKFIDFTSTIFVTNIGHANPRLLKYLSRALQKKFIHLTHKKEFYCLGRQLPLIIEKDSIF